jgi:hypothetical protein
MLQRSRLPGITALALFLLLAGCAEPTHDVSPWSRLLPSEAGQSINAMALDSRGEPVVTGSLFERADPFVEPLQGEDVGIFLTSMSNTGDEVWSTMARGARTGGHSVAVAPNGDVLLLGSFMSTLTLGGQSMFAAGEIPYRETFLARFNPQGQLLWTRPLNTGLSESPIATSVTTNADGDAIVGRNAEIVSFDADGNPLWTHTLSIPGRGITDVAVVSVDASGAVLVAGNDRLSDVTVIPGGFITKLTPSGQQVFTVQIHGEDPFGFVQISAMAVSPSGNVVFSGDVMKPLTFGSMTFDAINHTRFVAEISATGEPGWLDPVEVSQGGGDVNALAVAPNGRVYATGQYRGDELSIGGLTFGPTSGTAMFLVELDGSGKATDGRIFDRAGKFSAGRALAVDPVGALLLAGHFVGQIHLDDQTLTSAPSGSSFVARLALPFASHRRE